MGDLTAEAAERAALAGVVDIALDEIARQQRRALADVYEYVASLPDSAFEDHMIIKIRLAADSEEACAAGRAAVLAALPAARIEAPRVGGNPKYERVWFAYGELEVVEGAPAQKAVKLRRKA